jgi:hypothetical protein
MPTALQTSVLEFIGFRARRIRIVYEDLMKANCLVEFKCPVLYLANGACRLTYVRVQDYEETMYGKPDSWPLFNLGITHWFPKPAFSNDQFDPSEDKVGFKPVDEYCRSFLETYEALKKECEEEQPHKSEIETLREEIGVLKKALADTLDLLQMINKS